MIFSFILNMQPQSKSHTFEQLQMSEVSPDQLTKSVPEPQPTVNNSFKFNIRRCMFLIFLVISSSILLSQINAQPQRPPIQPPTETEDPNFFEFFVYCPYYYNDFSQEQNPPEQQNGDLRRRRLQFTGYENKITLKKADQTYNLKNLYLVEMRSDSKGALKYCGFTTEYLSSCDKGFKYRCSSPGPMFDLKVHELTDIVWINILNESNYATTVGGTSCMEQDNPSHCSLHAKPLGEQVKTYVDPANKDQSLQTTQQILISPMNWPVSTHVHGAEVRPTFDGNPLSWFDNKGRRGPGAFSLADKCYYDSFDQNDQENNHYMPPEIIVNNVLTGEELPYAKISRYPNIQNPGNLWYHDHAMRLTLYNVHHGLSGNYILRDDNVTQKIGVARKNQKLVMMSMLSGLEIEGENTIKGFDYSTLQLNTDTVYRFRILNNNYSFGAEYTFYFVNGNNCSSQNLSERIPMTLIGADSSLFDEGIYNQSQFTITQAERIEFLIMFAPGMQTYSACINDEDGKRFYAEDITLKPKDPNNQNNRTSIDQVKLPVEFQDFRDRSGLVALKRMRPLMKIDKTFSINGRVSFHQGKSENPVIGTYEDWYIINTMSSGHPIHIHLINFQVIQFLTLRKVQIIQNATEPDVKTYCTIYELDFIVAAIFHPDSKISQFKKNETIFAVLEDSNSVQYVQLCKAKTHIYQTTGATDSLALINIEDQEVQQNISGINVQRKFTKQEATFYSTQDQGTNVTVNDQKYVTGKNLPQRPFYKKWKDTAYVEGLQVGVFRMRWARSSYEDGRGNQEYFHVPVDQLREYPGFVYHCHILFHEDNEMMRPIMLQLPKDIKLNPLTPCNDVLDYSWEKKVKCINEVQCKGTK